MTLPNFLVIGAAKAGTTALYEYLKQHPDIYMSPHKEPRFFALEGETIDFKGPGDQERFSFVTDIESYRALFDDVSDEIAIGEASPWYLYVPQAAYRIKDRLPDVKLIAILREPVARAYSNFIHARREGLEPFDDFAQAMEAETERIAQNWSYRFHYKQKGFYYTQIKRYFDLFGREKVKIYLYDDLKRDQVGLLQDMFGFLGIDEQFIPDISQKHNVSGIPKSYLLDQSLTRDNWLIRMSKVLLPSKSLRQQLKNQLMQFNLSQKPPLDPEVRERFQVEYREDILKLQDLIDRDLSLWLHN